MPWRQAFSCDSSILWGPNGVQTPPSFLTLRGEHSRSTRKTDVQRLRPRCRSSLKSPPTMTELRSKGTASGHSRGEKRTGRPAAGPAAWRPWASQSVPAVAGSLGPWGGSQRRVGGAPRWEPDSGSGPAPPLALSPGAWRWVWGRGTAAPAAKLFGRGRDSLSWAV